MPDPENSADILARLRARDADAATEVFRRYAQRLIALARSHLEYRLRAKVDPEDVVQSVWRSFFHRHANGQFDLESWDGLWSLLVTITLRKCGHVAVRFSTAGRNYRLEQAGDAEWDAIGREPSPSQAMLLSDTVEHLMNRLHDDRERQILELALQGHNALEISEQVGRSERTVYRVLGRIGEVVQKMQDATDVSSEG